YDMPAMGTMAEMKGNADVTHEAAGRYRAKFDLPMGGTWPLHVSIQSASGTATQTFKLTVGGKGLSVSGGPGGVMPGMSAAPRIAAFEYPRAVLDPLRAAMDAVDRVRAHLARDETKGVTDDARTLGEALHAAKGALPNERSDLTDGMGRVAADV